MIVQVSTALAAPAARVWDALKKRDTFLYITRGMLCFRGSAGWPEILLDRGLVIETAFSPFPVLPAMPLVLRVVRVDEARLEGESNEGGPLVRRWDHILRVEPVSEGACRYTDRIDIDAGWLTPAVWAFANVFYRYRQSRWRRLVASWGLAPA